MMIPLRWTISELIIICWLWFCTRALFYVGRAQPGYSQVTLERSDFRTDFRTRQKNKEWHTHSGTKLILVHQGNSNLTSQYHSCIRVCYMQLSTTTSLVYYMVPWGGHMSAVFWRAVPLCGPLTKYELMTVVNTYYTQRHILCWCTRRVSWSRDYWVVIDPSI